MRKVLAILAVMAMVATAVQAQEVIYIGSGPEVYRNDALTGAPLPSPGNSLNIFSTAPAGSYDVELGPDITGDGVGELYVADRFADAGLALDGVTGALVQSYSTTGSDSPRGIGIGPDGAVYVNERTGDRVVKYDAASGAVLDADWGGFEARFLAGDGDLNGYELDWYEGNAYVSGEGRDVWVLDAAGNTLYTVETASGGSISGNVGTAWKDGILYISGRDADYVKAFNPADNSLTTVLSDSDGLTGITGDSVRDIEWGPDFNGDGDPELLLGQTDGILQYIDVEDKTVTNTLAMPTTSGEMFIYYVPEPATMALLGLGGLAALRRRRR